MTIKRIYNLTLSAASQTIGIEMGSKCLMLTFNTIPNKTL